MVARPGSLHGEEQLAACKVQGRGMAILQAVLGCMQSMGWTLPAPKAGSNLCKLHWLFLFKELPLILFPE